MRLKLNFDYAAIAVTYWLYYCAIIGFVSTFLLGRGFSNYEIGLVLMSAYLISFFLQPFLADLSDHSKVFTVHRVFELLTVVLIGCALLLLMPNMGGKLMFVIYVIAISLTMCLQTSLNAIVFRLEEGGHIINFGACRSFGSLFYALYSMVAGYAITGFGDRFLPLTGVVFGVLLLAVLLLSGRHLARAKRELAEAGITGPVTGKEEVESEQERITITQFMKRNPKYMIFCLGMLLMFTGNGVMGPFLYQIMMSVGGGAKELGWSFAIATIVEVPVLFFFSKIQARFTMVQVLRLSVVGFVLRLAIIAMAKNVTVILWAMTLDVISFALFMPGIVIFINERMSAGEAVKGQATYVMANAFANVLSSYFGGLILDTLSVTFLLRLAVAICATGAAIIFVVIDKVPFHKEGEGESGVSQNATE